MKQLLLYVTICLTIILSQNLATSLDYPEESEHELDPTLTITTDTITNSQPNKATVADPEVQTQPTSAPILNTLKDIERLARFVLLRGHIILDPAHKIKLNESRVSRLIDYFHDIQDRRRAGRQSLPMEDRDLGCHQYANNNRKKNTKEMCEAVSRECLSSSEMLDMVPKEPGLEFHQIVARLCPLILFQHSRHHCDGDSYRGQHEADDEAMKLVEPSIERVWGFGVLFVTLSIVVSMGGLIVLPFLNRESRRIILTLFEGLAVGGLAGSAILHLFPQAFDIVDDKYRLYFWNTFLIFGGIYLFYCIEMGLKIFTTFRSKGRRKRPSLGREDEKADVLAGITQMVYKQSTLPADITLGQHNDGHNETFEMQRLRANSEANRGQREALLNSTREQLAQCMSTVNVVPVSPNQAYATSSCSADTINKVAPDPQKSAKAHPKENFVPGVRSRRFDQDSSPTVAIDTVAWMIVLGDALLNFIDGLSIGAAFDRNILAGISISVAVMLEEVAHRLGTFAVLIRAGMTMKQSFLYILLCACACYPGLALGIFLGDEAEEASPYIFALAGGFFLYMALVDVMRAMNRSMENAARKGVRSMAHILALQNIGIILSVIFLALLAFYEREMDFENIELEEITEHSLE